MVSVGITSCLAVTQLNSGKAKDGKACGMPPKREPMVSTGRCSHSTASVATTSATTVPGRCALKRLICPVRPVGAVGIGLALG